MNSSKNQTKCMGTELTCLNTDTHCGWRGTEHLHRAGRRQSVGNLQSPQLLVWRRPEQSQTATDACG